MSTMSSSSTCSVTALAASTIPVADSTSPAPTDRLRQQERGHSSLRDRDGAQDNNTSSEIFGDITGTRVTKLFISSDAYTRKLAQQQWESQRQLVLKPQQLHLTLLRSLPSSACWSTTPLPKKDELKRIQMQEFAIHAVGTIDVHRQLYPKTRKTLQVPWSITSRASCRIRVWNLQTQIPFMMRSNLKASIAKNKKFFCCMKNGDGSISINKK